MSMVAWCLMAVTLGAADPEAVVLEFTAPSRCLPCQQIALTHTSDESPRAASDHTQPQAAI